jgi:hypothetical protein
MERTRDCTSWNIRMLLAGGLVVPTRSGLLGGYVYLALSFLYAVSLFITLVINIADQ